jgi:hypothetical protein
MVLFLTVAKKRNIFELQTSDMIKMEGNEKRDGEGINPQEVSNSSK